MPNYYAVQVTRGYLTVSLVKVVNGTQTVLASAVPSKTYVQNVWVQETLELNGDNLSAIVYQPGTGEYLDSSGDWVDSWTTAVTATDSSITTGGQVGVGRPVTQPLYLETNYFDDFTTATGTDLQDFDFTPPSPPPPPRSLFPGWSQYSSNGTNYFSVGNEQSSGYHLSGYNALVSAEMSNSITAAAWDTNAADDLTNAQATAAAYIASGTMPTLQLVARGTNLGSSTPSYYGLSFTESGDSGPELDLVRVNGGGTPVQLLQYEFPGDSQTELPTYDYLNGIWVQETLYVDGANVRASIYRTDTGQYLNSAGQWQVLPTYAVNLIDPNPLIQAGDAGFVRPSGSGYSVQPGYLDNFAVAPVSVVSTPPSVTLSAPSGTLSGAVAITSTPSEPVANYSITQLAFYLDDNPNYPVLSYLASSPSSGSQSTWNFDTNSLSNGTHTLLVVATDNEGNIGTATTTITVSNNTTLSMPSSGFPAHPNTVGITELDYATGDPNQTLVQNYVDTVVGPSQTDAANIHTWDSSVQQLVYTNVSNIDLGGGALNLVNNSSDDALLDFLNYAEKNDVSPEGAFYHVAVATSYSGGGHSTLPVDEFWGVYDASGGNDTASAYTGTSIPFGNSVNQAVYIGYLEPYWEINFDITTGASAGWSYALEYPTAVDSNNNPTAWGTLTTVNDTTDGFLATGQGQITFNAPSNWVPASIDSSLPMYYVRIRTVTAGTAPVANTIKGENYTDSPTGSDGSGVIPAYDWTLNPSGGYLDQSHYAIASAAGYTAHFGYQSRLFYDGSMRFYTNPADPTFKAWALTYYPPIVTGTEYANGLFVDNSAGSPPDQYVYNIEGYDFNSDEDTALTAGNVVNVIEPSGSYSSDYAALLNEIGQKLAQDNTNYWIMANTGSTQQPIGYTQTGQTYADAVISKVQSYYDEFDLQALAQNTNSFLSLYGQVYYRATTDHTEYAVMDSESKNGPQPNPEQDPQTQLTTLAAYYILAPNNASQGALDFFGGEATGSDWEVPNSNPPEYNHWSEAAAYNIGTPDSPLLPTPNVFTSGTESDGSSYVVYDRQFSGQSSGEPVSVLYKPLSTSGATGSSTATTVTLRGSYYVLQGNGTLSSTTVTSISLENGEGAILVDPATGGPEIAAGAAAMASNSSSSGDATVSPGSASPTHHALLAAASFERLLPGLFTSNAPGAGLLAQQGGASAELDQFLSLCAVENLTASDARGNGHASNSPTQNGQAPMTALVPHATLWFGSLRPSKTSNHYALNESTSPADNSIAGSPVDNPVVPSSAN